MSFLTLSGVKLSRDIVNHEALSDRHPRECVRCKNVTPSMSSVTHTYTHSLFCRPSGKDLLCNLVYYCCGLRLSSSLAITVRAALHLASANSNRGNPKLMKGYHHHALFSAHCWDETLIYSSAKIHTKTLLWYQSDCVIVSMTGLI